MVDDSQATTIDAFDESTPPATDETDTDSSSDSDGYGTPRKFIRRFQEAIGGRFRLDPAAGAEPTPIADTRFTKADDGLAKSWRGYRSIYLNPPYEGVIEQF